MDVKATYHSVAVQCAESSHVNWAQPTADVFQQGEGTHVWQIQNNTFSKKDIAHYIKILSSEELQVARQFYFTKDRKRYILTRSILRLLLSKYLKIKPADIFFQKNKFGKPFQGNVHNFHFNISHSGNLILMAFRFRKTLQEENFEIGIDVEHIQSDFDFELILENYFTEAEQAIILRDRSTATFFKYWTKKEAFVKLLGTGLSEKLSHMDFSKNENVLLFESFFTQKIFTHSFNIDKKNSLCTGHYLATIALERVNDNCQFYIY